MVSPTYVDSHVSRGYFETFFVTGSTKCHHLNALYSRLERMANSVCVIGRLVELDSCGMGCSVVHLAGITRMGGTAILLSRCIHRSYQVSTTGTVMFGGKGSGI